MSLEGRTALITGAARGIGHAFSEARIREGAGVPIADVNAPRAAEALGPAAGAVEKDVTRQDSIDEGVATAVEALGRIQSAGNDLIRHGIHMNAISPGLIEVEGEHGDGVDALLAKHGGRAPGQKRKEAGEAVPFGRMGRAGDLTGMPVFLATDEARYIVARTCNVDGGQWMN